MAPAWPIRCRMLTTATASDRPVPGRRRVGGHLQHAARAVRLQPAERRQLQPPDQHDLSDGRVVDYNYNSGIDTTISRLSSMSDSGGNIESYSYLGLSTIVREIRPGSGPHAGQGQRRFQRRCGDMSTGLDVGRVVDQLWVTADTVSSGTAAIPSHDYRAVRVRRTMKTPTCCTRTTWSIRRTRSCSTPTAPPAAMTAPL